MIVETASSVESLRMFRATRRGLTSSSSRNSSSSGKVDAMPSDSEADGGVAVMAASSGAVAGNTAEHLGHLIFLPARLSATFSLPLHSGQVRERVMAHRTPENRGERPA